MNQLECIHIVDDILDIEKDVVNRSAVIFDLDDTLYSEKEYIRSGYKKVAEFLGEIPKCYEKLWQAFNRSENAIDCVLKEERLYSEKLKTECLNIYRSHAPQIHLYPGVEEMLKRLKDHGILTGIITDGRPYGQHAKIDALGIGMYMDCMIITDELGGLEYRKPCVRAYQIICEKLDVPPESAVYIGDNIKKDFIGASKIGMDCIWFRNTDGLYVE